jgi:murein DD-endopeptidase MepM/ murein hydrolase activator NlpD
MSHSYSRDKLEESRRRKRAQQAAQQQRVNLPSAKSWLGVTPSQVAKPAQQTAPKTTVSRPAVQSSASWKGVTPSQVAKPAARQTAPKATHTAAVKQLPTFSVGQSLAQRTQQNIRNDNTRRARAARAREGQRQAAQANAAALKKDRAALAANSLKWHQTSDAAERRRLEAENSAIRARRGYAYDTHTGSTFDSKGNELTLAARQIYGGRAETAKQFRDVAQTKDFVRDTSRTAAQPSILEAVRGATSDDPYHAIQSGQKAHSIIANLLNRSGETWTDADTKARDEARDALQKEMQAIYQQYGATYQPRLSADETVKDLALRGADEQTLEYVRENLRLRDASDRLGQGLTAVGKRLEASIPSFVDTVKQAISNQSENKENEVFTRLEEQEKQLELQLQNMQSQDENGKVPADYQQVYNELQRVREEKNSLKVEKGVDQNLWSQRVLREANEAQANAEAGLAPAPRWVAEQAISLASNASTMATSAVPVVGTALGSLVMGAQAAGQRAFELNEQGKSAGEALGRGTVSGIIEAATEKLPLERMAEILHSGGANAVKNILRQMGTEATEEGVSYFLNYVSDLAAADPDAKFSLAELAQSAAGGAFGGLVFGTAGTVGAKLAQRNEGGIYDDTAYERDVVRSLQDADAQLRAARSLPEGAGRDAAVNAAREKMSQTIADYTTRYLAAHEEMNARDGLFGNPDGTANGFAGKKIPTYDELIEKPDVRVVDIRETPAGSYREQRRNFMNSEEAQQLYRQPVTNYDTGEMVFVTPKTLEHSFSNGGQLQISAAKQIQQIIAHSVLTSAEPITHGDTSATGIYTLFGAVRTNDGVQPVKLKVKEYQLGNQQIPQNIAEYFNTYGVPEQYASAYDNKVLALESIEKEEASSSVQPTLAAKQTAQGEYPSASSLKDASSSAATMPFGVNDPSTSSYITVADLMGLVNGDARRYLPKENKSFNQTLDGRLQLPGLLSDDTLAANSIRQNAGNSNTSDTNIPLSEAMQYGKTPEQAMREAKEKRAQADAGTAAGYAPVSDEMRRAGGKAKRTAADYLDLMDAVARRNAKSEQANRETYRELRSAWDEVRPLDRKIESVRRQAQLSDNDMRLLQAASASGHSEILADCENQPAALHLYELEKQRRETLAPVREYNRRVRLEREMQAAEWAETIASYASDKARGLYYLTETPERNIYDIFGKQHRAEADEFIREYLKPVHESVAESTRLQNRLRERISGLNLNRHESAIVQMLGEGEKAAALQYAEEHGIRLDGETEARLNHAANVFRETYDELFDMINDAEVRNGLEPTQKRGNYFPHFTEKAPDTLLARAMWRIGMKLTGRDTLTTDLAGLTEKFRPGHQWERHLQHREGKNTVYDAVTGFDQYVSEISDYIMLTDQIQKLRALEDSVRYTLSDEGTQRKIDEIKSDFMKDPLKRRQEIEAVYDDGGDRTAFQRAIDPLLRQKEAGMRNFVTELRRYTDSLCGKKHRGDRGIEDIVGRDVYEISKNVESRVAANMITLNPGSWLTNFIPLTQAAGEIDTKSLLQGMAETVRAAFSDDGFVNTSTFLTSRYGSDSISKTALRRVSDLAGAPMECIDHFTAESIVRARVAQNIGRHMALDEAFAEADSFASSLMADRSKGATPGAFEMKNPLVKVFTMYQLETNNQLRYFFKDLPRHMEGKSRAAAIASTGLALTKAFTLAFFYNRIYHELTGRDSALDPIGLIAEAFGLGDDDDEKKKSGVDTAFTLGKGIAEQLPFVGGLIGGGRVPISAAFPDVGKVADEITQGYDPKRIAFTAAKEAAKPAAYLLLPFGGGALKRTIEGAVTVGAGGSYGVNKNGEKILQFPVYGQTPRDWAQAMLFGKSSLKTAQDWSENGYDTLSAKETKAFDTLRERMSWHRDENGNAVDNSEAVFAAIKAMRAISESNENRDVSAGQARAMLFNDNDLSTAQKEFLDKNLISGGQSGFYTSETAFKVSQMVRESRQSDAIEAAKHGISVELFAEWDEILQQANSDNLVDAADYTEGGDNKLYATNTLLANILNEYASNPDVSDSEVNAFADYFIVSAMSKADREKWNDSVKGVVNASDYVKFKGDLAEYQKEFKGTGADNASNIASILDSYTNLSDEQKGVLMSTYTDSNKSNPFTVSDMEKRLKDNAFYKDLNDDGHTTLREYCNEYTQAIADGKDLTGWKAKAYMANEAGIKPEIYALFQVALKANDYDENGSYKSAEIEAAVKCIPGLTDKQRGYLWQAAKGGKTSKNNPWGATDVSKYSSSKSDAVNPVEGGTISSGFGSRSSFATSNGKSSSTNHKAIDIAAPAGTAVKAAMGGKITLVYKGDYGGYGNTVEIDHGNGIITKYHHMLDGSLEGLSVGQEVKAGQQIGKVGSTGNSTGPHLDFQVQKDGDFVDPRNYIPGYGAGSNLVYSGSASAGTIASGKSAASSSKKSSGSRKSGGSSGLRKPSALKGLPVFR